MTSLPAIVLVALLCALAIGAVFLRRRFPAGRSSGGRLIELAASAYLTPQITLHVVNAGGRSLLVAAGPAGPTLLAELTAGSRAPDERRSETECACSSSTMRP